MSEQKNTKQNEQKMALSLIRSPEVRNSELFDEVLTFVNNDTRSNEEIFDSLKNRIIRDSGGKIKESEAVRATKNLLGYFEFILRNSSVESHNIVDLQAVNGNVEYKT
jgi:hypothetical protein